MTSLMTDKKSQERQYIKRLMMIAIPMMVQNGISNFVNLLDNLMIGQVGTNALSGVAIANQLIFIFYLLIFGATAGVGIFTAQYHGKGDTEGIRNTFRFKIVFNTILASICVLVFAFCSPFLIELFLKGEGNPADAGGRTEDQQVEDEDQLVCDGNARKMVASICAIFVNLVGNFLLIYGYFGLPELGAVGAAIATVISRFVELGILIVYTGKHPHLFPFIRGAFKNFRLPKGLAMKFFLKALPLMSNETFWSLGMTTINQSYSYRSLDSVAAMNIESTLWNLMGVAFIAMGEAVGIMMGHILGAGELNEAKKTANKMRMVTVLCGLVFGVIMVGISPVFPLLYNTSSYVRHLASRFILIAAVTMPFCAYTHASYFIIRSGGNAFITVLFDSVYTWALVVPMAFCLSHFTSVPITWMVAIVRGMEIIKCLIGYILVRSGIWVKNIVDQAPTDKQEPAPSTETA